jgi:hypothetical protein
LEAINVYTETDRTRLKHYGLFSNPEPDIIVLANGIKEARGLGEQGLLARNLALVLSAKTEKFIIKDLQGCELTQEIRRQRELEQQRVRQKRWREKQKKLAQDRLWKEIEQARRRDAGVVMRGNAEQQLIDNPLLKALACKFAPERGVLVLQSRALLPLVDSAKKVLLNYARSGASFSFKTCYSQNNLMQGNDNIVLFLIALLFLAQDGVLLFDQEGDDVKITKV